MDNIRFLLVIAFAMISYMLWEAWQKDYNPKPEIAVSEQPIITNLNEELPVTSNSQIKDSPKIVEAVPAIEVSSDKIITVKTDVLILEIDTKGGTIRNLDLVKYPHDKENTIVNNMYSLVGLKPDKKDLSPIRLLDSKVENLFLAQSGLMTSPGSSKAPDHHTVFSTEKETYELGVGEDIISVPFVWTDNKGLVVTKTFTFKRGSYDINVDQKIQNNSSNTWSGRQYGQLLRAPYVDDKGNTFIRTFAGGVVYTEEDKYQKIDYDEMQDENLNVATLGGWSAMIQHYFATAWIPPKNQQNHFYTKELKDWRYVIGSYSPEVTVQPRTEIVLNSHLFSGPKIQPMMENIATGLELTVDYGWLTIFGKKIYWLLNKIHD